MIRHEPLRSCTYEAHKRYRGLAELGGEGCYPVKIGVIVKAGEVMSDNLGAKGRLRVGLRKTHQ
jgi:hypothetical protein